MKISFYVKTAEEFHVIAKATHIEKALEVISTIKADGVLLDIETAKLLFNRYAASPLKFRDHVVSKTHQGIKRVPIEEIYYFQADQKYVTVYHQQGTLLIEDTLKELENEFIDHFVRIHRHLLVSLKEIESLEKDESGKFWLKIKHSDTLFPVSRRKIVELRRQMIK